MCAITTVTKQINLKQNLNRILSTDTGEMRIAKANGLKRMENTYKVRDAYVQLICYYFVEGTLNFSSTCLLALILLFVMCFDEEK
jgi:hypothetical protein